LPFVLGAESIIVPNKDVDYDTIVDGIQSGQKRGKTSSIIIVAEGRVVGRSYEIQKTLSEKYNFDSKVCILGHIQRGGSPGAIDRYVGSYMGHAVVTGLKEGKTNQVAVVIDGRVQLTDFTNCLEKIDNLREDHISLAKILSI
jgi:6-phosphofructokinase 1